MAEQRVVVVGAGVMGRGIAQICAMAGYSTVLTDLSQSALDDALVVIEANLDKGVARGKVAPAARTTALSQLSTATDYAEAAPTADVVIEAITEDLDVKRRLFAHLSELVRSDTVLGTNTSSLSVTRIAEATKHPERVIGTHFFNPPHILKLLEIIVTPQTSDTTLERVRAIGADTGREMIVVKDSPGFATSRLGLVLGLEAIRMLQDGVASAEDIDRAMELGYRHPMGPLRLTDLIWLDTRLNIARYLHETLGAEQFRPPRLLIERVAAGKLGKKSGEGFYRW